MKTLEQIKNDYAKSKCYGFWNEILLHNDTYTIDNIYLNELLILVQKECLEHLSEGLIWRNDRELIESITDENNIIK